MDTPQSPQPQQPNTLGNASLGLGIAASALVFLVGLVMIIFRNHEVVRKILTLLFIVEASGGFLGLLGLIIGAGGAFSGNRTKSTAIVGMVLSVLAMAIFAIVMLILRRA